ncbi:MAG: class I SAM-dependent methyltransferase [Candidatus Omnitrophica bacterium]|nr:class I SAM-dependent methyltransferase [Candidatus Omnitrophota bacterium]
MGFKERLYQVLASFGIRLFTRIFPEYFAKDTLAPTDRYIEYPFAVRNLPKPPARLLDVGCAGSFFPLILAGFGYDAFAVDIRKYAIINKIKYENFRFCNESIIKTGFPDNYFDAITAISTVEHIGLSGRYGISEDSSADKIAVAEMKRITKPNGIIILTVPFGKAKIIKPFSRIYDRDLINQLINTLKIEKEEYYMQDSRDDWYKCTKEEAGEVEATGSRFALCMLALVKR